MEKGLIAASAECSVCKKTMHLIKISSDGYIWVCQKRGANGHHIKRHIRKKIAGWKRKSSVLGGPDAIVEREKSMFGKRKYNRGKRVNGTWMFGGIERPTNKYFFNVDHDRLKDTLLASIKSNVKDRHIGLLESLRLLDR
ncbi:DDE_Tnp_IS1595 domain-containing protein [Trichonephila clavipes]|nr:DDE_Tnp_IS1595 domain-containing protein [Trichonephila clavipes]